MALTDKLSDIGDAIRAKTGKTAKLTLDQMPAEIASIETGSGEEPVLKTKTITANGTYRASSDNADGYSSVTVNVASSGGSGFWSEDLVEAIIVDRTTVESVPLPAGITKIGNYSFENFESLVMTSLPDTITEIGVNAFALTFNLGLSRLPSNIKYIREGAFNNGYTPISVIPASVISIGPYAFKFAGGEITTLTFEGTPSSIGYQAFADWPQLRTINVPWAQGAVSGAPWGATNATINYNYTG